MTGGRAIYGGLPPAYLWLGQGRVAGIPVLAFFMIAAVVVAWFVMERTVLRPLHLRRRRQPEGGRALRRPGPPLQGRRARRLLDLRRRRRHPPCRPPRLGPAQRRRALPARRPRHGLHRHDHAPPRHLHRHGDLLRRAVHRRINNGLNLIGMDTYIQSIVKGLIILVAVAIVSRSTKLHLL
jgi:ribose transport system permease protein